MTDEHDVAEPERAKSTLEEYARSKEVLEEILDITTATQSGTEEDAAAALEKVSALIKQSGLNQK